MSGPRGRRIGATGGAAGTFRRRTGMMGNERVGTVKKAPHHVTGISASGPDKQPSAHVPARDRVGPQREDIMR